jgi:hypothetical protein
VRRRSLERTEARRTLAHLDRGEGMTGPDARRMTWVHTEGTTWRVERVTNRWQLSRYWPRTETWQRVGSYPSRADAIQAEYEPRPRSGC